MPSSSSALALSALKAHWRRDKSLRDVLAHLHAWQTMLLDFVAANQNGTSKPFLPAPHTWRTTPALNMEIWGRYQDTPLAEVQRQRAVQPRAKGCPAPP
ncbi:ClbS/DfsB family four-helix bundle protein [Trueperella abortisuis]|uniref:ClbS/DfsB family four-helix bundle protein n=1 Tax=Trueperella abortisuis TaxID=445930 RepID=UPI0027D8457A|nr:ClbS/DfsB family four-helix bundle protein [Trueperella abortisuis]